MINQPILETQGLRLRPVEQRDAEIIQKAASHREIADTMISLPHPYPDGEAGRYIRRQQQERQTDQAVSFVIERKVDCGFCGLAELRAINREHSLGELSFWLATEAWGQGYMSEAVKAVVSYGFIGLGLNRLYAYHMVRNPASGRVLEKNGFRQEGLLRQRVQKWGEFEDVALWAILRDAWQDRIDPESD